jgi:Tfp pilus assembly protein PilF
VRKVSLWSGLLASMALVAADGCKSTAPTAPPAASASAVNGSGTRSDLIAGSDPISLNTKSPPPGPDLYVSTARVYEGTQNTEAAKAQYDRALQIDPAFLPALLGYAHLLDTQKEFAAADKYYQKAVKKHPEVAAIYNDWGMSQQRRGRLDESAKLLTKATQLQPEKQLYRNNLAMVLVVMHRPEEAYRQLAAIEAPAVAHYNLATLLHRAGNDQMAAYHFAEASKDDPKWAQARQWAERLGAVGAPVSTNAVAVAGDVHVPPPDPRPDPAAAPYFVASRAPIVDQANAPPAPTMTPPPLPTPVMPQPVNGPAAYGPSAYGPAVNGATVVSPAACDGLPAFAGIEPGPVVTPTSGIAYPTQNPPRGAPPISGAAEPPSPEGMPPLPPNGLGLAPLPPVR